MAPRNLLDRAIAAVSPSWALQRASARQRLRRFDGGGRGGYEGASFGRRTDRWRAQHTDANAAIGGSLPILRARSRDLVRNNAWAAKGVATIEAWTVGTGITGQPTGRGLHADRVRDLWQRWAGTTACDADGDLDLAGLQAVVMRCMVESGDVLIRRRVRRQSDGLPVPLQLQVLEPDHLDLDRVTGQGSNEVILGVEYDAIGKRVAYWLDPDHPGTARPRANRVSVRVPASEILHVFRADRVGQVQGVPWLTPAMIRMRNLDEFEDGQLLRMTIAGSWAAFVTRASDPLVDDQNESEAIDEYEPGSVEYLQPGETIQFPTLPPVTGIDAFTAAQLRAIAAALQVPYEALTGDLTKVNFSSGRMGFNAFERSTAQWQRLLQRQFLDPLRAWFLDAAVAAGLPPAVLEIPWAWTPPARMILDPGTEGDADYTAVRNGAKTVSEILRARGKDPRAHLEELRADMDLLDELELTLDLDPRRSGQPGAGPAAGGAPEQDDGEDEPDEAETDDEDAEEPAEDDAAA